MSTVIISSAPYVRTPIGLDRRRKPVRRGHAGVGVSDPIPQSTDMTAAGFIKPNVQRTRRGIYLDMPCTVLLYVLAYVNVECFEDRTSLHIAIHES